MPAASRLTDLDDGGNTIILASTDVLINNLGAARVGDKDSKTPTPQTKIEGSPTVFVNNKPLVRVDDKDSGGDKMVVGSPNVFADS